MPNNQNKVVISIMLSGPAFDEDGHTVCNACGNSTCDHETCPDWATSSRGADQTLGEIAKNALKKHERGSIIN